jgi:hypothetical protein
MAIYRIYNGPSPTTAAQAVVTTGTVIKTLLQVSTSATKPAKLRAWGISFDGAAAAAGIKCECLETDVAATVTAHVTAGIVKIDGEALAGGDPVTNLIPVGTAATGYTASAEGTITTSRVFDAQLIQPTNQWVYQWPLGTEPVLNISKFTRIRVTAAAAVNAICFMDVEV